MEEDLAVCHKCGDKRYLAERSGRPGVMMVNLIHQLPVCKCTSWFECRRPECQQMKCPVCGCGEFYC